MSVHPDKPRLLAALNAAGRAVIPARPVSTARVVAVLAEHGYSLVLPHFHGRHWLDGTVEDLVLAGWGWPSPDQPRAPEFDPAAALAELGGVKIHHVDDPTDEDLLVRGVSDAALRREVLRRGLDLDAPEPTSGPTP